MGGARRGGWRYLKQDLRFQKWLYEGGFVNAISYIENIIVRCFVRLIPNDARSWFYKNILRS